MSGGSVPYHLRPHKSVDRRLFVNLLSRVERWRPLDKHTYISMGAYPMEDHKLLYRSLGLTNSISFDMNPNVVERQKFNKPVATCQCLCATSGEIVAGLEQKLEDCGFDTDGGVIIWLDYTAPREIGEQVREFEALLDKLKEGDVVRITLNANHRALHSDRDKDGKRFDADDLRARRFLKLAELLGDYLPSSAANVSINDRDFPVLLAQCLQSAAGKAFPTSSSKIFLPLSILRYADGQQMLSVTGIVCRSREKTEVPAALNMGEYAFYSPEWSSVHELIVPPLTTREKLFLEREVLSNNAGDVLEALGFSFAEYESMEDFVLSYRAYHRFYPNLLPTDL